MKWYFVNDNQPENYSFFIGSNIKIKLNNIKLLIYNNIFKNINKLKL